MGNYLHGYKQLLLLTLLAILLLCSDLKAGAESKPSIKHNGSDEFLKGIISQNALIDNLEGLGIKCVLRQSAINKSAANLEVAKVRLGSAAYYGGVLNGDTIKNLYHLNGNIIALSIEREGKTYQLNLQILAGQASQLSMIKNNHLNEGISKQSLKGETSNSKVIDKTGVTDLQTNKIAKKLLPYDITLIIDISGSMNQIDGTGNLTKFQWCHEQIRNLANQLAQYNKTITMTIFNAGHQTIEKCTPEKLEQVFATIEPNGGTDLVDPLVESLNNSLVKYEQNKKPTLIVVITDGLPNIPHDPKLVNYALSEFTRRLTKPGEVLVTVLQIGDTFEGGDFCIDLDDNLVDEGARYDIVDTKTFAEVKQQGLVQSMISAIVEAETNQQVSKKAKRLKRFINGLPSSSSQSLNNIDRELKQRQIERREIEKQILGQ